MIRKFDGDYARVKNFERWGIIDRSGKEVIPADYDEIGNYMNGSAYAKKGTQFGVVVQGEFKGLEAVDKIWDFSTDGLAYARKNKKLGFIDTKGNWVVEPQFDKARSFVNGLAPVYNGSKWGYIDTKGDLVVEYQFEDAEVFSTDGLAPVKVGKNWGFIDKSGKLVIPAQYSITAFGLEMFDAGSKGFINGVARVKFNKTWGFIDTEGNVVGKWYDNAELFSK